VAERSSEAWVFGGDGQFGMTGTFDFEEKLQASALFNRE
jgi:hypothetical protein